MTTIELRDLETRLAVWRAERHLTTAGQKEGLLANVLEELTEFVRAQDDNERVDAICDIIVFLINSKNSPVKIQEPKVDGVVTTQIFVELVFNNMYDDRTISLCSYMLEQLGYDSYKCMLETIKEISSRKQDPEQKKRWDAGEIIDSEKWKKWREQPKDSLYKADYDKCKISH